MRLLTLAGLVTGLVLASLFLRKRAEKASRIDRNPDRRYTIDDFIADQDL